MTQVLFIGAHPDDIEIGAGGLVAKLCGQGHEVYALVLTTDASSPQRCEESVHALNGLGVRVDRIHFAGFVDGELKASATSVWRTRQLVASADLSPAVIVTHTNADSHNDHVMANMLTHAVFRNSLILHYSVHISVEGGAFRPRLFIDVTGPLGLEKSKALATHTSQAERITKEPLDVYERKLAALTSNLAQAEAFEITWQGIRDRSFSEVLALSDSPFHRFWLTVLREDEGSFLLYEAYDRPSAGIDWSSSNESVGRDKLRKAFSDRWLPHAPLVEMPADAADCFELISSGAVVLVGGSVSNPIVRNLYNRFEEVNWVVEHTYPRSTYAFVLDKSTGGTIRPFEGKRGQILRDYFIISRIWNAYSGLPLLFVGGCTSTATRIGLELLANPTEELLHLFFDPGKNVECVLSHDVISDSTTVVRSRVWQKEQ